MDEQDGVRQVETTLEAACRVTFADSDPRTALLERVAYATAQYARHLASDRFGPDHPVTRAYLAAASEAALRTDVVSRVHDAVMNMPLGDGR